MEIEKTTSNYEKEEDFSFGTDEQINKLQMYLEKNFKLLDSTGIERSEIVHVVMN